MLDGEDDLREVAQAPYDSEDLLQTLVERHPEPLAGAQMAPDDPPRWLLVKREAGVPDAPGGGERWAIDHLFVDQYAVPTLVEVKRSTGTRIRREVVGQMLDYAANAQKYWSAESLRQAAEGQDGGVEAVAAFLQVEPETRAWGSTPSGPMWARTSDGDACDWSSSPTRSGRSCGG